MLSAEIVLTEELKRDSGDVMRVIMGKPVGPKHFPPSQVANDQPSIPGATSEKHCTSKANLSYTAAISDAKFQDDRQFRNQGQTRPHNWRLRRVHLPYSS